MVRLFNASKKYVIIYSSNYNKIEDVNYIRHRKFTDYIEENLPKWKLIKFLPNKHQYNGDYAKGSFSDFYFYQYIDE